MLGKSLFLQKALGCPLGMEQKHPLLYLRAFRAQRGRSWFSLYLSIRIVPGWLSFLHPHKAVSTQRPTHLARHSTMRDGDPFWGGAGLIFAKQEHLHQNRVPRGTCGLVLQAFCYLFRHTCPIWSPHTCMHAHPTYMHRTHTHRYTCTVQGTHSGTLGRTRTHTRAEARDQCCEPCGGDITAH